MPSMPNFTTSGSSVSMPKVATMACSGRTHCSALIAPSARPSASISARKRAHDHAACREHVQRGAARLLDQRDVEIAFLGSRWILA